MCRGAGETRTLQINSHHRSMAHMRGFAAHEYQVQVPCGMHPTRETMVGGDGPGELARQGARLLGSVPAPASRRAASAESNGVDRTCFDIPPASSRAPSGRIGPRGSQRPHGDAQGRHVFHGALAPEGSRNLGSACAGGVGPPVLGVQAMLFYARCGRACGRPLLRTASGGCAASSSGHVVV